MQLLQARHGLFLTDPENDAIDKILLKYGEFDEEEAALFELLIPKGSTVLECAANMGPYTPLLSKLIGSEGVLHTIEPNPVVVHQLHSQLALNGLNSNVVVHQVALSTHGDDGKFVHVEPKRNSSGSLHIGLPQALPEGCSTTTSVATCADSKGRLKSFTRMTTVDGLNIPRLSFLKLDVEGGEARLLQGANESLARWRPVVYAEEHSRHPRVAPAVQLLRGYGYDVFLHSFTTLVCRSPKPGSHPCTYKERNILALPVEQTSRVEPLLRAHFNETGREHERLHRL